MRNSAQNLKETMNLKLPSKHFRLVCWRLLYHLDVRKLVDRQDEIDACHHSRMKIEAWDKQKAQLPKQWHKLLSKRQRRLDWFREHGSVPDGWTPPDPKDPRRSMNRPIGAYLACRGYTAKEFKKKYSRVPLGHKRGRQHPWKTILLVADWLNPMKVD